MRSFILAAFLLLSITIGQAQIFPQSSYQPAPLGKDTICFRYHFAKGDTLIYAISAMDSITSGERPTLVKNRTERLIVICDSVDARKGIYRLRQRLVQSVSEERQSDTLRATRTSTPWMGRTATLLVDTLGRRIAVSIDDTLRVALGTGGPLQPWVIVDLGQSCGRVNESWLRTDTTLIPENAAPEPAYRYTSLFRVLGSVDTLKRTFRQLQYAQTGIGSLDVDASGRTMNYVGTVNSYGKLSMDTRLGIPFHLFATAEIKYTITVGNGSKDEGKHLLLMNYALEECRSINARRRYKRQQP